MMKELKKEDLDPTVFKLYDDYAHNKLERRVFIEKLSMYAIGGLTVPTLLSFMMPNYIDNLLVKNDDPRIKTEYITYESSKGGGKIKGLLAKPADAKGKLPGVVVVHENRGLNPYIEDVARRLALDGFIAFAPDALSPLGGYPGNDDEGREMQKKRDRNEMLEDFIAAYDFLKSRNDCSGKIGAVGFCFGGWIVNMMAVKITTLNAAVPYYGGQPSAEEVPSIQAPLLIQYAGLDERVNAGWPDYEKALQTNKKDFKVYFYEGANHGFHNNTTPRYDEIAANLSWNRTIDFFKAQLK